MVTFVVNKNMLIESQENMFVLVPVAPPKIQILMFCLLCEVTTGSNRK